MKPADMIPGIDVSAAQGRIDWQKVAGSGVRFAYVKCGEGNENRLDSTYAANVAGALGAGLFVGAYYVGWPLPENGDPSRSPRAQAERFWKAAKGLGCNPCELPPMFDCEWPTPDLWPKWGCTPLQICHWARDFVQEVEARWSRPCVLYSFPWFWNSIAPAVPPADLAWANHCLLSLASYRDISEDLPKGMPHHELAPWGRDAFTFWQFSADGGKRIPGVATDIDRQLFAGTEADLRKLANVDPAALRSADIRALRDAGRADAITTIVDGVAAGRKVTP